MKTISALLLALSAASLATASAEPHAQGVVRVRAHRMAKHHRSSALKRKDTHHSRRHQQMHDAEVTRQQRSGDQSGNQDASSSTDANASADASDKSQDDKSMTSNDDGKQSDDSSSSKTPEAVASASADTSNDDAKTKANVQPTTSADAKTQDAQPTASVAGADADADSDEHQHNHTRATATRTRDSAQAATANADRNQNKGTNRMGNGQRKQGEQAPKATAAAKAGDAGAVAGGGSASSLAAALALQHAGQDAGFSSSSSALAAKFTQSFDNNFKGKGSKKVSQDSLCVDKSQIAIASQSKGNPAVGQANSATSKNNFINFCATKQVPLMNGLQQRQLSCNPIPMGMIVPVQQAPTVKWKFPRNGQTVPANKNITLAMNVKNIETGVFTDAQGTYFSAPQDVTKEGLIIGHLHFVVNEVNGCDDTEPAPADKFVLFKGIDTAAVDGVLSFTAINGFPPGSYQACSMTSAANHQPVLVSLAQRKNQDDCICFQTK